MHLIEILFLGMGMYVLVEDSVSLNVGVFQIIWFYDPGNS